MGIKLQGIPASPGIAMGKVFLLDRDDLIIPHHTITEQDLPPEIARFEDALIKTRKEILEMQENIAHKMDTKHARIFNAHLLVLEDRMLIEEVIRGLRKDQRCVEHVFHQALQKFSDAFTSIEDEYLKERAADIHDVGKRVLRNLMGQRERSLAMIDEECIIIAYDLAPSETVFLNKEKVLGFITELGSRTSHAAILARSLEIPAVVGLENIGQHIAPEDIVILDGMNGSVVITPDEQTINVYQEKQRQFTQITGDLSKLHALPGTTVDKKTFPLYANIELPSELDSALLHGAEGIGLYRTEFFYMNRSVLPSEDDHYDVYKGVAEKMYPRMVTLRTMDLGGDKFLSTLNIPREMNPSMGQRGIRFCLQNTSIFKTQLKAILRANHLGNLNIMYPLISNLSEVHHANAVLEEAKQELRAKGITTHFDIDVGIMIEVPCAGLIADVLAKEVDFFSIGTNDLLQYTLAVDRVNEHISYLYDPAHPGVLRFIQNIIKEAHKKKIKVSMCGEMASEPMFIPLLLGMGLDSFSAPSSFIPEIKKVIRSVNLKECKNLVNEVTHLTTGRAIEEKLLSFLKLKTPELFIYNRFS